MVGTKNSEGDPSSYIRKIRKPMVEKKRRERMNHSIAQLKSLIAQTIKHNTVPMTRVDKADILELTVYHLTQLHQQQQAIAMTTQAAAYTAGYKECAREAITYLSNSRTTSAAITGSLSNHLHSSMLAADRHQTHVQQDGCCLNISQRTNIHSQMNRHSTPQRPGDSFNQPLPQLNLHGCTPIQYGDQCSKEVTSSSGYASASSSSSRDFSSSWSSSGESSNSYTEHSIDDVRHEQEISRADKNMDNCEQVVSRADKSTDVKSEQELSDADHDKSAGVVTLGEGKENEIGHVIKEIPWRPF